MSCREVCSIGRPVSSVSSKASSATLLSMSSPRRRMIFARSLAGSAAHFGNAALAAATAAPISASPPAATSARTWPVAGFGLSNTSLLSTYLPSIKCLIIVHVLRPLMSHISVRHCFRHCRGGGTLVLFSERHWVPACAGTTDIWQYQHDPESL